MGRSYELMANLPLAQTHFTEALQFIESSSDYDKARMEFYYLRGEIYPGSDFEQSRWLVLSVYTCPEILWD
jgi:hypothetical protein